MRDLDTYSSDYELIPFERLQEKFRRKALRGVLSGRNFNRALEIGCGFTSSLTEVEFEFADVIEPLDLCITQASSKLNSTHSTRVTFHKGFAEHLLSQSDELSNYDLILALSIVHEVQEPEVLLGAMRDALSETGTMAITLTNSNSIHRILGRELGIAEIGGKSAMELKMQQTTGAMTTEELAELLDKCGLKVDLMSTFFPKLLSHSSMQKLYDIGIADDGFLDKMYSLGDELSLFGSEIICLTSKR